MIKLNQTTVTEIRENSKVVSSVISVIKNIVALSSPILPIKFICFFKSWFSTSLVYLLKSIAISL